MPILKPTPVHLPAYLDDQVSSHKGVIDIKSMLNEVFNVFYISDIFCSKDEEARAYYACLSEAIHQLIDEGFLNKKP